MLCSVVQRSVIFLDVDGVICCNQDHVLEFPKLSVLSCLCTWMNADIVISSNWRLYPSLFVQLVEELRRWKIRVIGCTPRYEFHKNDRKRSLEIWTWVQKHGVKRWIAIDDRDLVAEEGGELLKGHFLKTNTALGLRGVDLLAAKSLKSLFPRSPSLVKLNVM